MLKSNESAGSFDADIYNDFKVIHIDPSLNIDNKIILVEIDNIFELYEHCFKFSNKNKKLYLRLVPRNRLDFLTIF